MMIWKPIAGRMDTVREPSVEVSTAAPALGVLYDGQGWISSLFGQVVRDLGYIQVSSEAASRMPAVTVPDAVMEAWSWAAMST
jgi:hypothetical protein